MSTGSSTNGSTGSAVKGDGGFASARNSADRTTPVRWIVLFTGRTATDDYQPSATDGEKPALVKEVTDLCVAFHPHSDIRLFPQSGDALLFYHAKSTGEWVITRVATAPNPDGVRTALEYCSIVLSNDDLQRLLGGNPFVADEAGSLLDRVREHFLGGDKTPILATPLPPVKGRSRADLPALPEIDADAIATPDNTRILQEFYAARASAGVTGTPPTFTTWWSSGGSVPAGYFDIVLRARATRAISLRDAADATSHLATEVKAALPRTTADDTVASDLARSILANADAAQQAVSHATSHLNTETPAQFQAQLTEAARLTAQITADIAALKGRLGTSLSSDVATRLTDLSERSSELSRDLPRVRHPNPFARRNSVPETSTLGALAATANAAAATAAPVSQVPTGSAPAKSNNGAILGGVAAVVVIGGLVAFGLMGRGNHNSTSPTSAPSAVANPSNGGVAVVKPPKPANPAAVALTNEQTAVEPVAKANALKAVPAAVKAAKGGAVPDATIETIAAAAITSAYKDTLTPAQDKTVYGNGKPWTYSHYKTVVPSLAVSIHEATIVAVTEAVAAQKIKKVEATVATPAATPKPRPRDNPPTDETPPPKKHTKRETSNSDSSGDGAKPKHHPTESSAPATPKAGNAAQLGL